MRGWLGAGSYRIAIYTAGVGDDDADQPLQASSYVAPAFREEAFHCPYCGLLAAQSWGQLEYHVGGVHRGANACLAKSGLRL